MRKDERIPKVYVYDKAKIEGGVVDQTLTDEQEKMYGGFGNSLRSPAGYKKIKILGKGGFAIVWLCEHLETQEKVAAKQFVKSESGSCHNELNINDHIFNSNMFVNEENEVKPKTEYDKILLNS